MIGLLFAAQSSARWVAAAQADSTPRIPERLPALDEATAWVAKKHGFPSMRDWLRGELDFIHGELQLKAGDTLCEIGSGEGLFGFSLLNDVLPGGRVVMTESDKTYINEIFYARWSRKLFDLVTPIYIHEDRRDSPMEYTGLEPASCDAIFIRMSFHHIRVPYLWVRGAADALKPGGRMLVVEHIAHHAKANDAYRHARHDFDQPEVFNNPGDDLYNPFGSWMGIAPWVVRTQVLADPRFRHLRYEKDYPGVMFKNFPYSITFERMADEEVPRGNSYGPPAAIPEGTVPDERLIRMFEIEKAIPFNEGMVE
jgi:SAM-dependent methyltransferase